MIKILIAGDFCPQNMTESMLDNRRYIEIFSDFMSLLEETDYNVINLECPVLIGKGKIPNEKNGILLKCKPSAIEALSSVKFNLLTLANNHFYDWGEQGVRDTILTSKSMGLDIVGGGENLFKAKQILFKKIKNKTFAFLNFCETEFSIATNNTGGSNPLNPISNFYQIREARSKADYVIVIAHGGHEHFQLPSPRMKEIFHFFIDSGADAVVNHHTHCFSGNEIYNGSPIIYSLGNFLFNSSFKEESTFHEGYVVVLSCNDGIVTFKEIPLIQCLNDPGVRFMTIEETANFDKKLTELNSIILDSNLLYSNFKEMAEKRSSVYLSNFQPYSDRISLSLFLRRFLPSLVSKKKWISILSLISCESHRDVLITALKEKIGSPYR